MYHKEKRVKEISKHFKERSKCYDKLGLWVKEPNIMQKTLEFMDLDSNMRIIDIGAGTGVVLEKALSLFPNVNKCVALDISGEMLGKISDNRIEKYLCDAHDNPFPSNYFDVALCRQSLHYMKDIEEVIQEIYRILLPNGVLVIGQITPCCEKDEEYWKIIIRTRQPLRQHFFTLDQLITLLKNVSFKIAKISQIRGKESLNSWLGRYKASDEQIEQMRNLYYNAPGFYKRMHNFIYTNHDIIFNNCWTFIRAIKKVIKVKLGEHN